LTLKSRGRIRSFWNPPTQTLHWTRAAGVELPDSDRPGILIRRKFTELLARHGEKQTTG
jgi:hypothetical protein